MATESDGSGLASSLTDLMTSLAVIFILLLVTSLNNTQQEGEDTRNSILLKLQELLQQQLVQYKNEGFEVKTDPKDPLGLIIVVPEGLLNFEINKATIPAPGVRFLTEIVPKMNGILCSDDFRDDVESIVIEGHTDSTGSDEINLPLSQERSLNVVRDSLRVLADQVSVNGRNESPRKCFLRLLSATGRGSVEPILGEGRTEDFRRSRRVIFKIRVRSLEQRIIQQIVPVK